MKVTITTTYEDGDMEIVKNAPPSPCERCDMGAACCGCPERRVWDERYGDEIRKRHLEDAVRAYHAYTRAMEKTQVAQSELRKALRDLDKMEIPVDE